MSDSLVLTFAEIEFLLQSRPPVITSLRESLELPVVDGSTAAAGLSSLLARGLCIRTDGTVVPSGDVVAIIAGLSTADRVTRSLGWIGERMVLVVILSGPTAPIALFPAELGQFTVRALDPDVSVVDQVVNFLDSCLTGAAESTVLVQSTTVDAKVSIAVAVDASGEWFLSDSISSPDRSTPSSRELAVGRIAELLVGETAGAR